MLWEQIQPNCMATTQSTSLTKFQRTYHHYHFEPHSDHQVATGTQVSLTTCLTSQTGFSLLGNNLYHKESGQEQTLWTWLLLEVILRLWNHHLLHWSIDRTTQPCQGVLHQCTWRGGTRTQRRDQSTARHKMYRPCIQHVFNFNLKCYRVLNCYSRTEEVSGLETVIKD